MEQGTNPYTPAASPNDERTHLKSYVFADRTRHFTRIVGFPYGVNILGLLEFLATIGLIFVISVYGGDLPRWLVQCILVTVCIGVISFDLWWRKQQPETSRWQRLFSPYTGGCFAYIPLWALFPVGAVAGLLTIVLGSK